MSKKLIKPKIETMIGSNDIQIAKLPKSNSRNSYELCQELGINDVELEWSEVDYENLTSFNIFCRMIRPQLAAANNKLAPNLMNQILEMKWREFQKANPLNKHVDSSDEDSENQDNDDQNNDNQDDDNQDDDDNQEDNDNVSEKQDESDEEEDKNASATSEESDEAPKSKMKKASNKSLKIRLSLKQPVRKSSREVRPVQKKMDEATEDEDLDDDERAMADVRPVRRAKQKLLNDSQESDFSSKESNSEECSVSEDEDGNRKSKKATLKPQIPGERKSNRSKRSNPSMRELTDREFEKMLASQAAAQEEKIKKKSKTTKKKKEKHSGARFTASKLHQLRQQNNSDNSDAEKSDHVWFCELCKDGGDLLLCDTCPKSFHKECLKLEQVPEGDWSCPVCTGEGLPEKGDSSEEDNHEAFCRFCKDGGDVILCDFCPLVYHLDCLNPPLTNPPNGDWKCPICKIIENPIKSKVKSILTWRWKNQPQNIDELDHTPQKKVLDSTIKKNVKKTPERELFCKFEFHSYWDCEWIDEIRLEVHEKMLHASFKKRFDLSEPPALEDGSSYGRQRNKNSDEDPHNLEQKFYRYGVKPDWLQIHHIIAHDGKVTKDRRYLVKWRELGYSDCTWESADTIVEELEDFDKHVEIYWNRRKLRSSKEGIKPENIKKSLLRKRLEQQPDYVEECGGRLHPYQLEGLNWLRFSWSQGTNTILADEMGLGKTIQAITFLFSLFKEGYVTHKPFLVSAPLSTVPNWEREFEFWAPELYVVTYTGMKENRIVIREHEFSYKDGAFMSSSRSCKMREGHRVKFDVLLTSYEYISLDNPTFSSIPWGVLIIDEAHRLKNNQSLFFRTLQDYKIDYKLLLTGTPLQNNLEELFNLLNFLEPNKFINMEEFLSEFSEISKDEQVLKLHDMLAPHMLRRMKTDVLKDIPSKSEFIVRIELSAMQKKYYKYILTKNFEALNAKGYSNQTSMLNIMMDLRKCCNHPYLFPGAEKDAPLTSKGTFDGLAIMKASGKLEMLDRMLRIIKRDQHRVLIFSQMTRMLDLLEDYLAAFGYGYERIDGSISGSRRQEAIDRFNSSSSQNFIFLLSTRAGGLGINLASADTVIIYDMDWNPHNDIQAFSRAHRIGQKNKVMIYRFVTRNTVEEKIATVCKQKMMLSELIVHRGMGSAGAHSVANEKRDSLTKQEISDILKYGAENLFTDDEEGQVVYNDEAIEKLLDRSQEGEVEKEKEFGMNEYLRSFKVASYQVKEGVEDDEEEEVEEVAEEKTDADTGTNVESDVAYWQRVLGPSYHEHVVQTLKEQEEIAKTLGKGKRVRKQINYAEREMMNDSESKAKLKKLTDAEFTNASDYEPTDSSDSDVQSNPEVEGENSPKKKKVPTATLR